MKIQSVVHDVRQRIETAGRHYQGAFKAYVDAQRKALTVVSRNGQSLANTEIGAAKNIYASARASFERARADGVRQLASQPTSYLPSSRPQLIEAYKTTMDLLVKTGNELNDVVWSGYRNVWGQLRGQPALEKPQADAEAKPSTASKSTSSPAKKTAARRKTSATSDSTAKASGSKAAASTAPETTTAGKSSAGRKTAGTSKRATTAKTAAANSDSDTGTSQSTDSDA